MSQLTIQYYQTTLSKLGISVIPTSEKQEPGYEINRKDQNQSRKPKSEDEPKESPHNGNNKQYC